MNLTHEVSRRLSRLSIKYKFEKPNDQRALDLMNATAVEVMNEFPAVVLGYGMSDEFRYHLKSAEKLSTLD